MLATSDNFSCTAPNGCVLLNSSRNAAALGIDEVDARLVTVPAGELAREHLGRPLPGPALLGAFAALTGVVSLPAVLAAIRDRFTSVPAEGNAAAAKAAHTFVLQHETEAAGHA